MPNKGYKISEEHRKNLRKSHIGLPGYWTGKKRPSPSQETIMKRIMKLRGKKRPVFSKLWRDNMAKAKIGNKYRLGKFHTKETREKISLTNKKRGIQPKVRYMAKGAIHHRWKGGITPENLRIRNSAKYQAWRDAVFVRDGFTCQKYGTRGGNLVAHHILNFAQWPELRFAIDNGITLSDKAHREFHKKYGHTNNTRAQMEEFLTYVTINLAVTN